MGFFLYFSMLLSWVVFVLLANFLTDNLVDLLGQKLGDFYQFCWQRRAGKFGKYYMLFFDRFLTKAYRGFGYSFMPIWFLVCLSIFLVFLFLFYVIWVRMLFVVANTWPQYFLWLLAGPLKDAWF